MNISESIQFVSAVYQLHRACVASLWKWYFWSGFRILLLFSSDTSLNRFQAARKPSQHFYLGQSPFYGALKIHLENTLWNTHLKNTESKHFYLGQSPFYGEPRYLLNQKDQTQSIGRVIVVEDQMLGISSNFQSLTF